MTAKPKMKSEERRLLEGLRIMAWNAVRPEAPAPDALPLDDPMLKGHICWIAADWLERLWECNNEHIQMIQTLRKRMARIREQAKDW